MERLKNFSCTRKAEHALRKDMKKQRNSRGASREPGMSCCTTGCANLPWGLPEEKQAWRGARSESEPLGIGVFFFDFREKALLWVKNRKAGHFCFRPVGLFLDQSLSASMSGCLPPEKTSAEKWMQQFPLSTMRNYCDFLCIRVGMADFHAPQMLHLPVFW